MPKKVFLERYGKVEGMKRWNSYKNKKKKGKRRSRRAQRGITL